MDSASTTVRLAMAASAIGLASAANARAEPGTSATLARWHLVAGRVPGPGSPRPSPAVVAAGAAPIRTDQIAAVDGQWGEGLASKPRFRRGMGALEGRSSHRFLDASFGERRVVLDVVHDRLAKGTPYSPHPIGTARGSAWTATVVGDMPLERTDSIRLSSTMSLQRSRPYSIVDDGHADTAFLGGVGMVWRRGDMLELGLDWQHVSSSASRTDLGRAILLAAGEPLARQGPGLTLQVAPGRSLDGHGLRLGLDARVDTIGARDAAVLGLGSGRDRRLTLSILSGF